MFIVRFCAFLCVFAGVFRLCVSVCAKLCVRVLYYYSASIGLTTTAYQKARAKAVAETDHEAQSKLRGTFSIGTVF